MSEDLNRVAVTNSDWAYDEADTPTIEEDIVKRRADAVEPGDVIRDDQAHAALKVIDVEYDGDRVTFTTEVYRWGPETRSTWSTDYREQFEVLEY